LKRLAWTLLGALGVVVFTALGIWQLERRVWKLSLIERVTQRVHAPAMPAPGPSEWSRVDAAGYEYRHVRVTGAFLHQDELRVQAVTGLGAGYWVMTPLRTDQGFIVFINRGFVPPERADPTTRGVGQIPGQVTLTGLLRITEPKGGFLRSNDPAHGRWFSRDIAAMTAALRLPEPVAPFFIDADAHSAAGPDGLPVGGLTVVAFRNTHLSYAITWFALALLSVFATVRLWREGATLRGC
jgi:surfeit locus 1 family protein